jgi:alkylation response protein AidB-like acyl-CoA dehydrogenase
VENLVGQENRGWDCAKFLLGNERTGIARVGYSKQRVQRIKELASKVMVGDRPLIEDERFREKVAAVEVDLKALEMTQMRVLAEDSRRKSNLPNPMSSILKIRGSEIQQATTALLMEIAGPLALPYRMEADEAAFGANEPPQDEWAAPAAPAYFNYRKVTIYGGSNEIQRNILAKAVLGF